MWSQAHTHTCTHHRVNRREHVVNNNWIHTHTYRRQIHTDHTAGKEQNKNKNSPPIWICLRTSNVINWLTGCFLIVSILSYCAQNTIAKLGAIIYESDEDEFYLNAELSLQGTLIQERTVTERTATGATIQRKILTYPGQETEEVEEWETTEVNDQVTGQKHTKRAGDKKPVAAKPTKKPSAAAEAALKALVETEIVIVPGHTKVEFDEKTNTKTVTEKTTTGHQVTTTTVTPDGRTKTQTRTFYDPIPVPMDDEEEEIEEEEETIEETYEPSRTTRTTTDESQKKKQVTDTQSQNTAKQTTLAKNTDVSKVDQSKQTTNVSQVTQQQTMKTETRKTSVQTQVQSQVQSTTSTNQTQIEQSKNTQNTQSIKQVDDSNMQVAVPGSNQPRTIVVKKKLDSGEEIEIHTTISADGLTKTCRRIVTKPAEELEITDYEETSTYEPGQVKIKTTTKSYPTETETTEKRSVTQTSKKVTEEHVKKQVHQEQLQQTTQQQQQTTKQQQHVTDSTQRKTSTNVQKQNQNTQLVEQHDTRLQNPTEEYVAASHKTTHTKVTESVTMIVQDDQGTRGHTQTKQTSSKNQDVSLTQQGQTVTNTKNQKSTTVSQQELYDESTNLTQEQIQEKLSKQQKQTKTTTTSSQHTNLTQEQQLQLEEQQRQIEQRKTQTTTKTTEQLTKEEQLRLQREQQQRQTQTQTTTTTTQQQTNLTKEQQLQLLEQQKKQQTTTTNTKLTKEQQQIKNTFGKHQDQTISTETHVITGQKTTIVARNGQSVTRPDTLPGEETTEEVRYFPGGVEYTWRTVRKDGSSKMSQRTLYDPIPVPVEGQDEEEEEEETYEETTTKSSGKKKLPSAHASNVSGPAGKRN